MPVALHVNFGFRYTMPLCFRQYTSKLFFPGGCVVFPVWTDCFEKISIAIDSIVLPRSHFIPNSLGSFSKYVNLYLFTLDLLGFSVLPKSQKSFPLMRIDSAFSKGRNFVFLGKPIICLWKKLAHLVIHFK